LLGIGKKSHAWQTFLQVIPVFICRPGLAVPGPQRELLGELPATVSREPGSAAEVLC
jgi:hypothetical protein